jgi:hypothetical protein
MQLSSEAPGRLECDPNEAVRVYTERLVQHRAKTEQLNRLDDRVAIIRLACAGVVAIFVYLSFTGSHIGVPGTIFFALAFVALTLYHGRVADRLSRSKRLVAFYEAGLRRTNGGWEGHGVSGDRFVDAHHPYTSDLDIFGKGSIFELLCTARTLAGEDRLAEMLSTNCDAETARARQRAVQELSTGLDLREDLALLGQDVRSRIHPEGLSAWGRQPAQLTSAPMRYLALAIAITTVATGIAWLGHLISYWYFIAAFTAGRLLERSISRELVSVVRAVQKTSAEFEFLALMLGRIEQEEFESTELRSIRDSLVRDGRTASQRIRQFSKLVGYLDANLNQLFAMVSPILLWTTQCAYAIDSWRVRNGNDIEPWIEAVGQFEAYASLGGYAYEQTGQPYPDIVDADSEIYFDARQIGHPLISADKLVRNDIRISSKARMYIVSGSNMSGKSTFLRTVGVNAILAMAGAPVRAESLRIQPRAIGTSITTQDSLQGGVSRFYAEITRLRQVVDLANNGPTLFLLDEVLHGTNSHDRRIGAEAILRSLVRSGAVGLATTHDLAISKIADDPSLAAVNVHLEDQMVDGRMTFDYRLREGVVEKSNALALMRAVGLEV